jgi:hypothetical protein
MEQFISKLKKDFNVEVTNWTNSTESCPSVELRFNDEQAKVIENNINQGYSLYDLALSGFMNAKMNNYVLPYAAEPKIRLVSLSPLYIEVAAELAIIYFIILRLLKP